MPIRQNIDDQLEIKTVRFEGHVTVDDFVEYSHSCSGHAKIRASFVDMSRITICDVGYEWLLPHVELVRERVEKSNVFKVEVIWAPTDLGYGVARIYQTLAQNNLNVLLFRDEKDARDSLAQVFNEDDVSGEESAN